MSARRIAEYTVSMIDAEIRSKISTALSAIRVDRADAAVSTEVPKRYFWYSMAKGFETPCVFIICQGIDMNNASRASNQLCSTARVVVSVLVEDRIKTNLVIKSWRYQAALHKILHLTSLLSTDSKVRLVIKVDRVSFSPEFTDTQDENAPGAVFRKEVALELEVEHYEAL
jgi:hypothetical protein